MSFYDAAVPAYLQILGSLTGILTKAEAHCAAKNVAPEVLLGARLYPDMLPLSKQIQLACDFAAKGCARLTGSEVPSTSHPLGLRGGGEGGTTPALGAVVNAIADALAELGVEHVELPATAERVWQAIQAARAQPR